jgi:very-short-patch-repair endonuclease
MDRELDRRVAMRASRQYGLITKQQALAAGVTAAGIKHRVMSGRWQIVRPGVYVIAGSPPSWEQAVLAACLAGGTATVASHITAAHLWGFGVSPEPGIHVMSDRDRRIRLDGVIAHRSLLLPKLDRTRHRKIPATTAARTIIEISGSIGPWVTGSWLDAGIRRRVTRLQEVRSCVARLAGPGRRKLSVIRTVLTTRLPGYDPGDSNLEVRALRALRDGGLPAPVQQHRVTVGGRNCRIDLAYPEAMVAIEIDGWEWHGNRSAFDADRARANELEAAGWHVFRFTSATTDAEIARVIRTALTNLGHFGSQSEPD